ncbi:MAG: phosphoribosyltransferase family protein, partial [Acidilobaceae archaeon]
SIKNIFYIPKGSIKREDRVLVVDDIVQSGLTLSVMKKLVDRVGAKLLGVAAIVVVGDEWRKRVDIEKIEALVTISKT